MRRRVWAPLGETPIQRAWDRHERITALAALVRAPWASRLDLYYKLLDHNARTADITAFVCEIRAHLRRPIILVCDRLSAHRSAVRRLLAQGLDWLRVEWLPAYTPELDPVENVWDQSKYGHLANFVPDDVEQFQCALANVLETFRHEPNRLHSFFHAAHLIE